MKTYTQFQDYLAAAGIPHEISELGKQFALSQLPYIHEDFVNGHIYPENDLGKHEYRDMQSVEQCIVNVKSQIVGMIRDTDVSGKDQTQIRLKQLLRDNCKGLKWKFTKGYYLFYGNFLELQLDDQELDSDEVFFKPFGSFDNMWASNYDKHFPEIWQKRQQLDAEKTMRILKTA